MIAPLESESAAPALALAGNGNHTARPPATFNGQLTLYHANGKGTGAALRFELKPPERRRAGCFYVDLAHQKTTADRSEGDPRHATFDWENKGTIKLGFSDICEFLLVLEGRRESLGGDSRGLYHTNGDTNTMITLRRSDQRPGFSLGVSRKDGHGDQLFKGHIVISEAEARGLQSILDRGLFHMTMGIPGAPRYGSSEAHSHQS